MKDMQCKSGVSIAAFLPAMIMGALIFYGMYLANEIRQVFPLPFIYQTPAHTSFRRYLDYVALLIRGTTPGDNGGGSVGKKQAPEIDPSLELTILLYNYYECTILVLH